MIRRTITVDTPYAEMPKSAQVDWLADDVEDAIATAGLRWSVSTSDIHRRLEQGVLTAECPRDSIYRVALTLADEARASQETLDDD